MTKYLVALFFMIYSANALAVCYHNGIAYNTGVVVGGYVCSADGAWRRR